jgi:hypothetical protein
VVFSSAFSSFVGSSVLAASALGSAGAGVAYFCCSFFGAGDGFLTGAAFLAGAAFGVSFLTYAGFGVSFFTAVFFGSTFFVLTTGFYSGFLATFFYSTFFSTFASFTGSAAAS